MSKPRPSSAWIWPFWVAAILGILTACAPLSPPGAGVPTGEVTAPRMPASSSAQDVTAAPEDVGGPSSSAPDAPAEAETSVAERPTTPATAPLQPLARGPARWLPAAWKDLPGWHQDRSLALWPALLASCTVPAAGWAEVCARALLEPPADDAAARAFLTTWLAPWRMEDESGRSTGLATGYFEPILDASPTRREGYTVAVHAPPTDLARRQPHWSRRDLETHPEARAALQGREIAWLTHPLDLLLLQIQGSGRLRWLEGGAERQIRVAYAGHNGHPYRSVGRWLIEQGELRPHEASWPGIRQWTLRHPHRLQELMWANPRVIYFRAEPLADPGTGPRGAQGVPLTPGRSVAVDPRAVPYGTPLWIDTTEPLSTTPLQRLVMAQDTGSAIVGAVRIDYFWGWGDDALEQAGRMRQPLRAWALWPRSERGPRDALAE